MIHDMKKVIYSLLVGSLIGLTIVSCEKKSNDDKQGAISGRLISNTTCKSDYRYSAPVDETPDSISCVEYSFDNETHKLTLKHINAGFNCCADSLYCKIELKGDTILVREFEKSAQCDCNCLYDLDIEIDGVDMKKYQVKFVEPYIREQTEIVFGIDLARVMEGSYSVIRKSYPWGVNSLFE